MGMEYAMMLPLCSRRYANSGGRPLSRADVVSVPVSFRVGGRLFRVPLRLTALASRAHGYSWSPPSPVALACVPN